MESVQDVSKALSERARTASLEELRSQGRQRVRVLRAEHIAAYIEQAVQRAIIESGLIPKEEAERLSASSKEEFQHLLAERQREASELQRLREEAACAKTALRDAEARREAAETQVRNLEADLADLENELDRARTRIDDLVRELEARPTASVAVPVAASPVAASPVAAAPVAPAPQSSIDASHAQLMLQMMQELGRLKAVVDDRAAAPTNAGASQGDHGMAEAIQKLAATMNDRLDQFGRKMGISSAVEARPVKLDALFDDLDTGEVESNLETLEVKATKSAGIGGHLERLRKLKGGGA